MSDTPTSGGPPDCCTWHLEAWQRRIVRERDEARTRADHLLDDLAEARARADQLDDLIDWAELSWIYQRRMTETEFRQLATHPWNDAPRDKGAFREAADG